MNKPIDELPLMYSLPLREFVDIYLGVSVNEVGGVIIRDRLYDKRPISAKHALVIESLTKNKTICYIEWPNKMFQKDADPILWELSCWLDSEEKRARDVARMHADNVKRWLFDKNVDMLSRHLADPKHPLQLGGNTGHNIDIARLVIRKKMWKTIAWMGFVGLKTKEEEL